MMLMRMRMDTGWMRGVWRFMARMVRIAVVLLFVVDLTLLSGVLESRVLPGAASWLTGARVLCWIEGWRPLRIRGLRVYDAAAPKNAPPLVAADGITLSYQLGTMRFFSLVEVLGLRLQVDGNDPQYPNYGFLSRFIQGASTGNGGSIPRRWIPQRIVLHDLSVRGDMPEWTMALAGLDIDLYLRGLEHFHAIIHGSKAQGGWRGGEAAPGLTMPAGNVTARLFRNGDRVDFAGNVHLPDFVRLDGGAMVSLGVAPELSLAINSFSVYGPVFGELLSAWLPTPLHFDSVRVEPLRLDAVLSLAEPTVSNARADIWIEGLRVGPPEASWYAGPLQLAASGTHEGHSDVKLVATLNRQQEITADISTSADDLRATVVFENWNQDQIVALCPERYTEWTGWLPPMKQISGAFTCVRGGRRVNLLGDLELETVQGETPTLGLTGMYAFSGEADMLANLAMGNGAVSVAVTNSSAEGVAAEVNMVDLSIAELTNMLLPHFPQDSIQATVNGALRLRQSEAGEYPFSLRLSADTPGYGNWMVSEPLSPVIMEGKGSIGSGFSTIDVSTLDIVMNEAANATLSDIRLTIGDIHAAGAFQGNVSLTAAGAWLGLDDLWGDMTFHGALKLEGMKRLLVSPLAVAFESLGYDDLALPYGMPLTLDAPMAFDMDASQLKAGPMSLQLGDDTHLTTDQIVLAFGEEMTINVASLAFETGFAPLVARQYLDEADGRLEITARQVRYDKDGWNGDITYRCDARHLGVANNLATLRGILVQGEAAFQPMLDGKGTARIETLQVAGVTLLGINSDIRGEDDRILLENIAVDLFGGGVNGQAELRPFDAGMPLILRGEARNLDLSIFTQEFEPPSLILTGRVNGAFSVGMAHRKLGLFDVDFVAQDGFTMNRDMVEQLLMNQYMDDVTGGRQMSRVLRTVIGDAPQRPFERAQLKLGLEDERIAGYSRLESEALNLTVDIKADPLALLEALRIRQQ